MSPENTKPPLGKVSSDYFSMLRWTRHEVQKLASVEGISPSMAAAAAEVIEFLQVEENRVHGLLLPEKKKAVA